MAVAAETITHQEQYAHSLHALRRWGGQLAIERETGLEAEHENFQELTFGDYVSALREMVRTDGEFKDRLDIDDRRGHRIINGQVCDAHGTPMASVIARGKQSSEVLAAKESKYEGQAIRDAGDEIVAKRADALQPGQTLFVLSMPPSEDLKSHPEIYHDVLGYREGLSYWQYYAKADNDTMISGAYSVDMSDETTWRQLLADRGVEIPDDADANTFSRHGFEMAATPAEAEQLVKAMRADYYERVGADRERYSVSEYLQRHDQVIKTFFEAYYPALAEATHSLKNNEVMQSLAQTLLETPLDRLKPEIRQNLVRVANGHSFDEKLSKTMDSVIRYAVVEELRKGLSAYMGLEKTADGQVWRGSPVQSLTDGAASVVYTNRLLADNVSSGIEAGRSYGGCPGQIELGEDVNDILAGAVDLQTAYGGNSLLSRGRREKWKTKIDKCAVEACPTRPGEVKVGPCGVCMERCQVLYDSGKDPAKMSSVTRKVSKVVLTNLKGGTSEGQGSKTADKPVRYQYN